LNTTTLKLQISSLQAKARWTVRIGAAPTRQNRLFTTRNAWLDDKLLKLNAAVGLFQPLGGGAVRQTDFHQPGLRAWNSSREAGTICDPASLDCPPIE